MNLQAKPVETIYFELSKSRPIKTLSEIKQSIAFDCIGQFFCGFDFVRPFSAIKIIGLISVELGFMISMTRCLIRYVGYTGNSLLASTECICKHNVIVTAV